jgi:hypothetical protein
MEERDKATILTLTPATLADPNVDPVEWVDRYARLHGVEYNYKTNSVRQRGESLEIGHFLSEMRLSAHRLEQGSVKKMLPDALSVWRRAKAKSFLESLKAELRFQPNQHDLVAQWVAAATGSKNELDVVVMRHWISQVKKKLYGLPVDHHLLVVLYGASGGGKSYAVLKLVAPLLEVTTYRDLTIFADSFSRRAFQRNFIMFFDELAKSGQADINALKNVVTAPTVEWRGLGVETMHSAPQNCTFIGCSNLPLRERIHDPTSMRRFWELRCAPRLDWENINAIDYQALWRSVDENAPCPIIPVLSEIRRLQEQDLSERDVVRGWLEYMCEPAPFSEASPTTYTLYSDFNGWCKWQGISSYPGLQTFARSLQDKIDGLKWDASSRRTHRGMAWSLKVNSPVPPAEEAREPNRVTGLAESGGSSEAVSAVEQIEEDT